MQKVKNICWWRNCYKRDLLSEFSLQWTARKSRLVHFEILFLFLILLIGRSVSWSCLFIIEDFSVQTRLCFTSSLSRVVYNTYLVIDLWLCFSNFSKTITSVCFSLIHGFGSLLHKWRVIISLPKIQVLSYLLFQYGI